MTRSWCLLTKVMQRRKQRQGLWLFPFHSRHNIEELSESIIFFLSKKESESTCSASWSKVLCHVEFKSLLSLYNNLVTLIPVFFVDSFIKMIIDVSVAFFFLKQYWNIFTKGRQIKHITFWSFWTVTFRKIKTFGEEEVTVCISQFWLLQNFASF